MHKTEQNRGNHYGKPPVARQHRKSLHKVAPEKNLFKGSLEWYQHYCDGRKDYLCYRGREMRAHYYDSNDFKPFFSENLAFAPDTAFFIGRPDFHWIGLLNRTAQKIYLLDNKGKMAPGFPLAGSTPFVVTPLKPGGQLAVVGYGPSVYAYRLDF